MDLVTIFLSIIVVLFLVNAFMNQKQANPKNFPPGPRPLPIIGNIHIMDIRKPHKTFMELSKQYGSVFSVQIGMSKSIILCGYETLKDALLNHAEIFSDRPHTPLFSETSKGHGIVFATGENWKVMRRFSLSTLRDYGMGKRTIEDKIIEESDCLVQKLRSYEGKPFDNVTSIYAAVTNIIVSILLSKRFDYDDPTILRLMGLTNENIKLLSSPWVFLYNTYPFLAKWLPGAHNKIFENVKEFLDFIRRIFTQYKKELDVNDQRNLIDAFLTKQQEGKPESTAYFHDENLTALVADLFGAGMETTSTTLRWAILLMMKYPEIQQKVQNEIEQVVGSAQPQMEHRKQMPYTDAVIHEILRFGDIAPVGLPHATTQDITFRGYFIPKGATIITLVHSALRDKDYFEKPYEFYPEHFLDSAGNFKKNEAFIPFSLGKRSCAGETLAKMEIFLFFTSLLQNFTFQAPPGTKLDLTPSLASTNAPKPHEICAICLSFCPTSKGDDFQLFLNFNRFIRKLTLQRFFALKTESNKHLDTHHTSGPPTDEVKHQDVKAPSNFYPIHAQGPHIRVFQDLVFEEFKSMGKTKTRNKNNLSFKEREALAGWKKNNDLVICLAEKGGGVVIMSLEYYEEESLHILSDKNFYRQIAKDPYKRISEEYNKLINSGLSDGILNKQEHKFLQYNNDNKPYFYFLTKIHKSITRPLGRPIISNTNCLTSNLSHYIDLYLQKHVISLSSYLRDSTQLIEQLLTIGWEPGVYLITCDVMSLYTNIGHEIGVQCVEEFLESDPDITEDHRNFIFKGLKFILENNYFIYNKQVYHQCNGMAMGSKVAPAYANLFMGAFEKKLIPGSLEFSTYTQLFRRYIDDLFFLWRGPVESIGVFMAHLNSNDRGIKFTIEYNEDNINFLVLNIAHKGTNYITSTYFKKVDINSYLEYNSAHQKQWLKNVPYGQFKRIRKNCMEDNTFAIQAKILSKRFIEKNYLSFMDLVTVLLSIVVILFLTNVFRNQKQGKYKKFPPGPKPLPILGNLLMIDMSKPYKTFYQLSKQYGSIFSVQMGRTKMVILCGYDTIKDALINNAEVFSDRPRNPLFTDSRKDHGILFANGENWKVMRRFTLSTLRDYGMGKKTIENKITEEAECLVQKLRSYEGKPFGDFSCIGAAVTNIIVAILLSKRYDYEDQTILRLIALVTENLRLIGSPWVRLYNIFPALMDRLPGPHRTVFKNLREFHSFIRATFTKYKKDLDINDQRNLIDAFLAKQKEEKQESTQYYHNENLTVLVGDLFGAGMETTSTTLRWSILLMMKYHEIQEKVQNEIERVIGSAQPQMEHRKEMPYTDAVVHEIQRFGDIAPTTVPHLASQDVTFRGYFIPKGTIILPVLHSLHKDKEYFKKPDEFYPEHFLDSEGNFKKNEAFIPFSIGKRSCAGETLAKMELFLFFTTLLQNFTFKAPLGAKLDLTPALGSTNSPKPFEVCAVPRS
ncbi:uncharacterized protein LOC130360958 [Hyla sarda]|uniref:uncharacterized protein LOC130360958 n=1 Tax=Hyla sarda TaxID=327740 RepID=UPI0024C3FB75|nr:uncharacterized protein LOC130360958 [Hyla sarda]